MRDTGCRRRVSSQDARRLALQMLEDVEAVRLQACRAEAGAYVDADLVLAWRDAAKAKAKGHVFVGCCDHVTVGTKTVGD